jgi:hypothetical protein
MVPGGFAAKAILGLFALTVPGVEDADRLLLFSVQFLLRVLFTIVAMGTGVAIPAMLARSARAGATTRALVLLALLRAPLP